MRAQRWRLIATVAQRQYGVVTLLQLRETGFSASAISRAVAAGHLFLLRQGVYAVGHPPTDRRAHLLAAALSCGPTARLSHLPCAGLLGFLKPTGGPLEVTVPTRAGLKRDDLLIHRAQLGPGEFTVFERVPCTSPARTLLDLAATRPWDLERAIKEAGGLGRLHVDEILRLLERYPRRRGSRRLRELLLGRSTVPEFTRSELERRIYELCRGFGIECPRMNMLIDAGGGPYEVDCVWFEQRLLIECDSRWHNNPITAREDALRDQALTLAGWRVLRLRWLQIVDAPERAAQTISLLLAEQSRLLRSVEPSRRSNLSR